MGRLVNQEGKGVNVRGGKEANYELQMMGCS